MVHGRSTTGSAALSGFDTADTPGFTGPASDALNDRSSEGVLGIVAPRVFAAARRQSPQMQLPWCPSTNGVDSLHDCMQKSQRKSDICMSSGLLPGRCTRRAYDAAAWRAFEARGCGVVAGVRGLSLRRRGGRSRLVVAAAWRACAMAGSPRTAMPRARPFFAAILRAVARRISLVNRTIVVFTIATIGIVGGSVAASWVALRQVAREVRRDGFRHLVVGFGESGGRGDPSIRLFGADAIPDAGASLVEAFERFKREGETFELLIDTEIDGKPLQRYLRAVRRSTLQSLNESKSVDLRPPSLPAQPGDPVEAMLVIDRPSSDLELLVNTKRIWAVVAGALAVIALVVVYVILVRRDLLRPARRLRDTVEKVRKGDIGARSAIRTGDEYQRLGESFNAMLDQFEQAQRQLRAINESLDLKLGELSEANVGLYESNRLKSEFLANVSHELRTPLNSIIGFAELLDDLARNDPAADPKRLRYIHHILSSGRSLLDMINELLSMAKIEAGRMEVSIEPTSVTDLVEGIVAIMRPQAVARRIEVAVRVPAGLPTVETDPGKLQQILYNFLSNAIKFSPEGAEVTISAERVMRSDGTAGVRISVHDRGPGVPFDMQETIFEKFRQVDASKTRQYSGTGLGLAICRELAQMLSAAVGLSSEPDKGSTFFVELSFEFKGRELPPLMAES